MELRDQLQSVLGNSYSLERELGGGGMSRVFTAKETAFGRRVVIKVLPSELAAAVNVDRFKREIMLAANLQHPHIVPVLAAGEMDGVPYYTMPFIDGLSLRARLARGPMAIAEVVSMLRDVARALAYAHERGVIHRDIKPDNVLLAGGSATVTDFGIAKAISAARATAGDGGLTQFGTSIGTPAYMSPEQAAADPSADHRADIYSFGCMAYELLTGQPPFAGRTPQRLLAAQMSERPTPVAEVRLETPPLLAELVMRCLEKEPDARPQSAADVARLLDAVTSGASQAMAAAAFTKAPSASRTTVAYVLALVAVYVVAQGAIVGLGAPRWVLPIAVGLMLVGLPILLLTAYAQRVARRVVLTPRATSDGGGSTPARTAVESIALRASPHLTWRRSVNAIAGMVGGLAVLVIALMALRPYGIGPLGSLLGAGKLHKHERILVADFTSTGSDTTLGPPVTEAVRTDLGQSPIIAVVSAQTIAAALQRMQLAPTHGVDTSTARSLARREGIKAFVTGDVHSLAGGGFVVTVRLIATDSGQTLAALSQSAGGTKDLIPTIGEVSRQLRRRMGESLRRVQSSPELAQVTTASLPALEKYTEGNHAMSMEGDLDKAIALFREATKLDTSFASAYRALAIALGNEGRNRDEQIQALDKAYAHSDRLPHTERLLSIAAYWSQGPAPDIDKAAQAYESVLVADPTQYAALNNLGLVYSDRRDFARAESLFRRSVAASPTQLVAYGNLIATLAAQGKVAAVESTQAAQLKASGNNPRTAIGQTALSFVKGDYARAVTLADSIATANPRVPDLDRSRIAIRSSVAFVHGQLAEGLRLESRNAVSESATGDPLALLGASFDSAFVDLWFLDSKRSALSRIDAGLRKTPMSTLSPLNRPYSALAELYAFAGRADLARATLADFGRIASTLPTETAASIRYSIESMIALAEHRDADAAREARQITAGNCVTCALPLIALAYDQAKQPDSAIAVYTRYIESTALVNRYDTDKNFLASSYKRLGELWEEKGNSDKAIRYYTKFVDLWKDADPSLQPKVAEVRKRLVRLSDTEGRRS